ncbi:uncharacterized protein LACBIDRAFT_326641 [Laccaria bicolor S238N-H82]|uniref:Predicted protein n=1 Tax=Laccaria bicolor (strain S238N-H82 / ATCC MYA-4686) TaxID=486041 RepID=B0D9B4_LACBS|nr:uncharacterized protein LACBIDRAFT_326641 [Laccaria bicolor S238N-H82]EDR09218.1 predicted protein [Laccaria bicolor S238N-H82]|eukprot:XP_001880531.1 predicted protein [Laccaria bicolor S238N-H82]
MSMEQQIGCGLSQDSFHGFHMELVMDSIWINPGKGMTDDEVKDKGKGRDMANIGEVSGSGSESGDQDELKGQDDGEDEGEEDGEDEGEDEGGEDGEEEGEDEGEEEGGDDDEVEGEKDKESGDDVEKVEEDAGKVKDAGVDQDVEMVDVNKVGTVAKTTVSVATAAMVNTIEVTTLEEMAVTLDDLQGASKTIGGFARGNAVGNTYGFGDEPLVDLSALQQKGKIMVYILSSDPSTIVPTETPPSFQKMLAICHMSKPLFNALGKKWPTIKNPEYTIFVHDIVWTLLGSFEEITSVEGDEEITWHTENNKPILQILLSNFTLPSLSSTIVVASAASPGLPVAAAATTSQLVPVMAGPPQGVRVHFTQEQTIMADALEIPVALRRAGNALKLQEHYTRYLALLEAEKKFKKMQKDGTWPAELRLPVGREIPNLFIGKSTWHDYWTKIFPHIAEYPEMVKWLSNDEDSMETEELFGVKMKAYHFAELLAWVQNGGSLIKPKKGAAKEASAGTSKKSSTSKKPAGSAKKVATSKSGSSKRKYSQLSLLLWMAFLIPHALASPQSAPFPDIGFQDFSEFIINNFGDKISLPTVMMMLLSMTNNTELLSLHFKQSPGSNATSWIKCLARAIIEQLGDNDADTLFSENELSMFKNATARENNVSSLAVKLVEFSHLLGLYPYNNKQKFTDHECTALTADTEVMQLYLNSALYIKVGQKLWVDCKFSTSVINGTYHLHASTCGWANYFNDTYGNDCITLSCRQVWAAFMQESIRQASEISGVNFVTRDVSSIEEVTEEAFAAFGLIQPAKGHMC